MCLEIEEIFKKFQTSDFLSNWILIVFLMCQVFTEHDSVERSRRLQTEPIDLYECFKAFTKEEELGEDELW